LQVSKTDFSEAAKAVDIIINSGASKIELSAKVSNPGIYRLCQVSIGVKQFELLGPRMGCRYKFSVDKVPSNILLESETQLIAGIEQILTITLDTGSYYIGEVSFLSHCLINILRTDLLNLIPIIIKFIYVGYDFTRTGVNGSSA